MIIDKILDRKDGDDYEPAAFYRDIFPYGAVGFGITSAMDSGSEDDVKRELCEYIADNEYNEEICEYVNSVEWL